MFLYIISMVVILWFKIYSDDIACLIFKEAGLLTGKLIELHHKLKYYLMINTYRDTNYVQCTPLASVSAY